MKLHVKNLIGKAKLVYMAFVFTVGLTAVVSAPAVPALACNVSSGNHSVKFNGGYQDVSGIQGVTAVLDAYNPTPVFESSSFWVMLANLYYGKYAQVGWVKYYYDTYEHIFLQYKDDSGTMYTYYYNSSGDYWTDVGPQSVPTGSASATVYYLSGTLYLSYGGGATFTASVTWAPGELQVYGETHTYEAASPTSKGDHVPGDTADKIEAQVVKYYKNSSWSYASLSCSSSGNGGVQATGSPGFQVWDTRCSD